MPTNKNLLGSYDAANQFLGKRDSRTMPSIKFTTVHRTIGGDFRGYGYKSEYRANAESVIAVRYHDTDVVMYYPDGRIELNSGGYDTFTTKQRINDFCRAAKISIGQTNFKWTVYTKTGNFEFKDHMIILPDGNVQGQPKIVYNENFGFVRLEIVEYSADSRQLFVHLTRLGKKWYRENKSMYKDKLDTDVLYDLFEPVIANSEWEFVRPAEIGALVDDDLPILTNDAYRHHDTNELMFVTWVYALNNHSWVISGLEPDYKAGVIKFEGTNGEYHSKDQAISAIFTALAEYAAHYAN